jgi:cell division protein FtsI (penicillin-binding protein 3)
LKQPKSTKIHFGRIYYLVAAIILIWVFLEVRLYHVQIKNHEYYTKISTKQVEKKITIPASRGIIYDRNNVQLATNLIHYDLGVDKKNLKYPGRLATAFGKIFRNSNSYYLNRIKKGSDFVYLERKVSEKNMKLLHDIGEPGLVILKNYRRFYPFAEYCSQIIGFTDVDDKGASGIELQYQDDLKGINGWTILQVDAKRRFAYSAEHPVIEPESGTNIQLTIDKNYQSIVGENLKIGVKKYNAKSGIGILMKPRTGEILAMCAYPAFNPNYPSRSKPEHRRNSFVADVFEPGSTFKLFPIAALLQEGIKKSNDIVFCENGSYKYFDHTVRDSKKYGWLSLQRVFENSSNIGMVKLVQDLPKNIFYRYLKNFSFGSETGVNLTSENSGLLEKPEKFSGISKGMISHGYEIATTALQLTNAYCAVVNGGNLMKPYVVNKIISQENEVKEKRSSLKIRQVISEDVAKVLNKFMLGTVERGTGIKAKIEGYKVGGKTGTAQKYDNKKKKYIKGKYFSSFIGFAPYENPEFVLAIFLDEPNPKYYGGDTAAPIFKLIMSRLLKVTPGIEDEENGNYLTANENEDVPDLRGMHISIARDVLKSRNIDYDILGEGQYISSQKLVDDEVILKLGNLEINATRMPNLKGLTIREALKKIDFSRLRVKIDGNGKITKQTVKAGTHIKNKQVLILSCNN